MAKREPRWVAVFLKQLEQTGNVRIAAERAGVDFSTAYQRRQRHGEFAERWALRLRSGQALRLAAFRDGSGQALRQDQGERDEMEAEAVQLPLTSCRQDQDEREGAGAPPPPAAVPLPIAAQQGGAELATRPDGKVVKGSAARWGKRAEEAFLTELTVGANVRLAARAAGFSTTAVYKQRAKSRRFAAAWDAALEAGKARVQAYLVEAATRTFDPDELPIADEREMPRVSISEAINIARLGPSAGSGRAGQGGAGRDEDGGQFYSDEEMDEARERIFDRLTRIRDRIADHEQETGCCHACGQPLPEEPLDETKCALPMASTILYDAN